MNISPKSGIKSFFPAWNAILLAAIVLVTGVMGTGQKILAEEAGQQSYERTDLVSAVPDTAGTWYSLLKAPWGMASSPGGPWWIAAEGYVTFVTGEGVPFPGISPKALTVPASPGASEPATPTGIVFNDGDFLLARDTPARFIIVTLDGTIAGRHDYDNDRYEAIRLADNAPYAAYTGITIAAMRGKNYLYVTNFRQGRVEVFDGDFRPVMLNEGAFTHPLIPRVYSPYNIRTIANLIFVTFALPDSGGNEALSGEGLGYAAVFDAEGAMIAFFEPGPWLDAPWGMTLAPEEFGEFSGHVLVGSHGSGRIAAFDPETGEFSGHLTDEGGEPLTIPGLRGLAFGNDGLAGPSNILYFTAGASHTRYGLFGAITTTETPRSEDEMEMH